MEEGWKDESGGKTIWEGKYLDIPLLERGCATHLCCSACMCVCVFSEMIMCGNAEASEAQNMQDMDGGKEEEEGN